MADYNERSRRLARNLFWSENDRETYFCPDCGRREGDVTRFEVHHINGEPLDNRPENRVGLCRFCHFLREGMRPPAVDVWRLADYLTPRSGAVEPPEDREPPESVPDTSEGEARQTEAEETPVDISEFVVGSEEWQADPDVDKDTIEEFLV